LVTLVDYYLFSFYLNNKGYELRKQSKYDDANLAYDAAIQAFDRAFDLSKRSAKTWNQKGLALREMGKQYDEAVMMFNKAVEAFDRAIELDGNLYGAWINKGSIFEAQGNIFRKQGSLLYGKKLYSL